MRARKPTISRKRQVLERDGYMCRFLGCDEIADLTVDHIVPRSKGGGPWMENLITLCAAHNKAKADSTDLAWLCYREL